jgi:type IV secretion system protein VirB10
MNFFSKKTSAPPATTTIPTVSTAAGPEGLSLWDRHRKTLFLFAGCFAVMLVARACSSHSREEAHAKKVEHVNSDAAREQADKDSQISLLRSQLEDAATRDKKRQDADSGNQLTPEQARQVAAIDASGGKLPAGPRDYSQDQQRPTQPTLSETTRALVPDRPVSLVISYRDSEGASTPASTAGAQPPRVDAPAELAPALAVADATASTVNPEDKEHDLASADGEKYRVRDGTWLPCTSQLRINGSLAGSINCLISIPIYSTSGVHLLMPQGTIALGRVAAVGNQNQQRLFVVFDAFIMPDGYTVSIKDAKGLDQIGQTGLRDKVDHHYAQMFGVSIGIAALGGLAQIGNYSNAAITPSSQYRAGMTQGLSESSTQILNKFTNILPTFTIREGARNNIHLPLNLWLPDYSKHTMRGDL